MKKKDLKKEINGLIDEAMLDCLLLVQLSEQKEAEKFEVLIGSLLTLRDEMMARVNGFVAKNDPKEIKKYYSLLRQELYNKVEAVATEIHSLIQPK